MSANLGYSGKLTTWVGVADMARAIAWYKDVLGFDELYRVDEMGWAELRTPVEQVNFGISQLEKPSVEGGSTPVFGVSDIHAARAALEAEDVRFDGETLVIEGMVKLATFFDPDGNKLMLSESLQ
jgi:catechol 2,3-dioxygenase-like lactoylglutathione lyase family enzyme